MTNSNFEVDWGNIPRKKKAQEVTQEQKIKSIQNPENKPTGLDLLGKIADAIGGGAIGLAQGGINTGANIAQFPSDIYSWLTGKQGYQAPRPNFTQYAPQSDIGQKFEKGGEFLAPFISSPQLAAEATLGKAMFGGKLIPRLVSDILGGAAESEDRKTGAILGGLTPAAGKAIQKIRETPLTEARASKKLEKAKKLAGEELLDIPMTPEFFRNLEYQMSSPFLKPSKMQLNTLMGKAAKGDYPSYFALQSALGDVSRELLYPAQQKGKGLLGIIGQYLSPPKSSAAERLTGQQIDALRKKYIADAMAHLEKTGKGKIAKLEKEGRKEYSNYMKFKPTRDKIAIAALAGAVPSAKYLKHFMEKD